MLELIKINKSYTTGSFTQHALKNLTLKFRKNEFIAVLGPSGSGKTTLLNIVGGLDRYDNGDLIINGKSTKKFKNEDWDAYRNNCIGFVFQSYNLISHISVLDNVEMGMTLSGISASKRRKKAKEVLKKVGLKDHMHKKPNQLSGGQMQRVAIARAIANDPDIILADEPTGALDSTTSIQIMDLIKEIAKDKLVIMVTHNSKLAHEYANRIFKLQDGELLTDSNPITETDEQEEYMIRKTSMNFLAALKLSFNNIVTKKGRTLLTAFASSIGIIGIALILSLSNGFDQQINKFESETISSFPMIISQNSMELDMEEIRKIRNESMGVGGNDKFPDVQVIYPYESIQETAIHNNKINHEYINYIKDMDVSLLTGVSYTSMMPLNLFRKDNNVIKPINSRMAAFQSIPKPVDQTKASYIEKNYDLLYGEYPKNKEDIVLIVNTANKLNSVVVEALGLDNEAKIIDFKDIIGSEIKLITNDNYYLPINNYFTINSDLNKAYDRDDNITLKVSGIIRLKEDLKFAVLSEGIGYQEELIEFIINNSIKSKVVKKQIESDYNVLTGEKFDLTKEDGVMEKNRILSSLGGNDIPFMINLYPDDFSDKEQIIEYLDEYNKDLPDEDKIIYTDLSATFSSLSGNIMDAITIVLIAFSSIALIVSSIMIGIITYISVLERTKEIGILRSLGARKKDIARVFNAETFIVGLTSGILGIIIARLLIFPANDLIEKLTDLPNVAVLNPLHALVLILISLTLTLIGGYIPALMASKKDPVEALRTE
ncbi:MAG: ABC transporter ATP-binding protein/permease [Bacilli bacterium]|nr:ABC transporter ATP-binding protein/permease [Bacilli bacterium]MDD4809332.1 ABC transporter ATP-binding protein/permease [Bacilli bacterium]